jgi:leucyl aminopeptidase
MSAPDAGALGLLVSCDGPVPAQPELSRGQLVAAGFQGEPVGTFVLPKLTDSAVVAIGVGGRAAFEPARLREAGAAFAREAGGHERLAIALDALEGIDPEAAAQAIVERVLLGCYRYDRLKSAPTGTVTRELTLVTLAGDTEVDRRGGGRDLVFAGVQVLAVTSATRRTVTSTRRAWARSRSYWVPNAASRLSCSTSRSDLLGAAVVLAVCSALRDLGSRTHVTAYLMCTDNMPSGTALALGDVITIRGGMTVEVEDT